MNLVTPSLRRPFTVIVVVIAVVAAAAMALRRMPRDIFPTLGIPTIYVAQPYGGMDAVQVESESIQNASEVFLVLGQVHVQMFQVATSVTSPILSA